MGSSVKENVKPKTTQAQCIQEIGDTMKRPSLCIIRIKEREESQVKDIESIFWKIAEGNFPNLKKEMFTKAKT